ncbi:30S ribosomal protein S5 [Candidatus Woesearchaeota archaeon]|nr:30S ribosomal protein S5 [Candidatus Woesearchaeota archaeon]
MVIADVPEAPVVDALAVVAKEKKAVLSADAGRQRLDSWKPRTELGRKAKNGELAGIDQVLDSGQRLLEPEIVDMLLPELSSEMLMIGQSKGKFGGGQRRAFRQTQKKTAEGNKPSFGTMTAVGNRNGYVGLGYGKSKETLLSREKALRNAKLSIIKVRRGCGSWQCGCKTPHTIPFKVVGKCGSAVIELMPAPKGAGLRVAEECRKLLALAGIKDVWSMTTGQTRTTINLVAACFDALKKLGETKVMHDQAENLGVVEGSVLEQ